MYLGPNNLARKYRTTVEAPSLGGIFSKIFGKILPRELSPHQMRKTSQKRKAQVQALKAQISETERAAANQVADAQAAAQVEVLKAKALPGVTAPTPGASFGVPSPTTAFPLMEQNPAQLAPVSPLVNTNAPTASAQTDDKTMLYVGLGALGLLGAYLYTRGRK